MDPALWWLIGVIIYLVIGLCLYLFAIVLDFIVAGDRLPQEEMRQSRKEALWLIFLWGPGLLIILVEVLANGIKYLVAKLSSKSMRATRSAPPPPQ